MFDYRINIFYYTKKISKDIVNALLVRACFFMHVVRIRAKYKHAKKEDMRLYSSVNVICFKLPI